MNFIYYEQNRHININRKISLRTYKHVDPN